MSTENGMEIIRVWPGNTPVSREPFSQYSVIEPIDRDSLASG